MQQSVYIAGPMTGIKDWNFPAFFDAEYQLLELGYTVLNPAHNDGKNVEDALKSAGSPEKPNYPWAYYMKRDLPHVMSCDMVCLLPGWQNSRGALLEVHVAQALGLPLMILKDGELIPRVEVVGISGYARSGKDTVANILVEKHGYTKMSFADPMREALLRLNPMIQVGDMHGILLSSAVSQLGWEHLKTASPDVRPLMQRLGTEVGREMFGENFWIDQAIARIPDGAKVVFADTRFQNEARAIEALGGKVLRVYRPGVEAANTHISEVDLDTYGFDAIIANQGTLEDLEADVENIIANNWSNLTLEVI